jgi:hypothetical protein
VNTSWSVLIDCGSERPLSLPTFTAYCKICRKKIRINLTDKKIMTVSIGQRHTTFLDLGNGGYSRQRMIPRESHQKTMKTFPFDGQDFTPRA